MKSNVDRFKYISYGKTGRDTDLRYGKAGGVNSAQTYYSTTTKASSRPNH